MRQPFGRRMELCYSYCRYNYSLPNKNLAGCAKRFIKSMLNHRKRRLYFIILLVMSIGLAVSLGLYALRQNVDLYATPQQVSQQSPHKGQTFRLGGMVVKGSVQHGQGLQVSFILTDYHANIRVEYQGVLPSLFHDGQGIVAQGSLNAQGVFIADQVLAKHDANYKPPGISNSQAVEPSFTSSIKAAQS